MAAAAPSRPLDRPRASSSAARSAISSIGSAIGYVVDFVDLGIGDFRWYTFNVADAAISIAIVILIVLAIWPASGGDRRIGEPPSRRAGAAAACRPRSTRSSRPPRRSEERPVDG